MLAGRADRPAARPRARDHRAGPGRGHRASPSRGAGKGDVVLVAGKGHERGQYAGAAQSSRSTTARWQRGAGRAGQHRAGQQRAGAAGGRAAHRAAIEQGLIRSHGPDMQEDRDPAVRERRSPGSPAPAPTRWPTRRAIVTGPVVIDSRQAGPGSLFAALPGDPGRRARLRRPGGGGRRHRGAGHPAGRRAGADRRRTCRGARPRWPGPWWTGCPASRSPRSPGRRARPPPRTWPPS